VIAKKDLQIRGPGEVLGTRQTGLVNMRIADIVRDEYLLTEIRTASSVMRDQYPEHVRPLIQRWLGKSDRYGSV
jgi:ATP-dependent DNA helicase RecG